MESALRAEYGTEFKLPGQIDEAVHLKGVTDGEIGRPFVEIRAVIEFASLWDVIAVAGKEGRIGVGAALTCSA